MAKSLHFIQATEINLLFKEKGLDCILHLRAGCLACAPVLECDEALLQEAYSIMNTYLEGTFMKVRPNEMDASVVEVY